MRWQRQAICPPKKKRVRPRRRRYKDLLTAAVVLLFVLSVVAVSRVTQAAEGASSHWLPGANGDIFLAVPPEPGFLVANTFWYQTGNVGETVLEGQVELNLDISTFLNLTALTYTFEQPILGGRYTVGAVVPFGNVDLDVDDYRSTWRAIALVRELVRPQRYCSDSVPDELGVRTLVV